MNDAEITVAYALDGERPEIADSAWVAPGARLMGRVVLAAESSVWFNAVLRGDNEPIVVGARSNIQDGSVLHTDMGFPLTIGEDCTVGHAAILHGCTIGPRSLIGMGATILNGVVIPEHCLVGANALVTEGKAFEPGSLILGSPAKAVRRLDEAAIEALKVTAQGYVKNARRFRAGLAPL